MADSPKLTDLKSLVEFASAQAEKIFRKTGELVPMYHAINADGQHRVMLPPGFSKDLDVALMKAAFVLENIDRFVFICEAWIVDARQSGVPPLDLENYREGSLSENPDRREVVMFAAENRRGELMLGQRYILRPEHGKPSLAPLRIDSGFDESAGRMVGMLPREK